MGKKKPQVAVQQITPEMRREREIAEICKRIDGGNIPANPTRLFKVGDLVKIGNLRGITVTHVIRNGMAYQVHFEYMGKEYGRDKQVVGDGVWAWIDVFPVDSRGNYEPFAIKSDIRINYTNSDIGSLLHKAYNPGIDCDPDYQRGLVWTMEQKLSLIDSIFQTIDIGKFTVISRSFSDKRPQHYEMIDGKQRLNAICEFYEDRWPWRGKLFSELCFADSYHFESFPIIQGEVSGVTDAQILTLFVKLNTTGTPMDAAHLERVKAEAVIGDDNYCLNDLDKMPYQVKEIWAGGDVVPVPRQDYEAMSHKAAIHDDLKTKLDAALAALEDLRRLFV
jgi:hypothetical protein